MNISFIPPASPQICLYLKHQIGCFDGTQGNRGIFNTSPCLKQLCVDDSEEGIWLYIPHLAQTGGEGIISVKNWNGSSRHRLCTSKQNVWEKASRLMDVFCGATMGFSWICNALKVEWIQRQALSHLQRLCPQIKCRKDMNSFSQLQSH